MNNLHKLHLGAFDKSVEGWLNVDVTPHIFISRMPYFHFLLYKIGILTKQRYEQHRTGVFNKLQYMNIAEGIRLPDGSCQAVFSSHLFEHLFRNEVYLLIEEIQRVLVSGGICRVVVPDMNRIVSNYTEDDNIEDFLQSVFEVTSKTHQKNYHHWGFNGQYLSKLFKDRGFSKTNICSYRQGKCPDIYLLDNRPDSLFFEAIK